MSSVGPQPVSDERPSRLVLMYLIMTACYVGTSVALGVLFHWKSVGSSVVFGLALALIMFVYTEGKRRGLWSRPKRR
jgi:F0F1-type ATP synthase membrane subunit a